PLIQSAIRATRRRWTCTRDSMAWRDRPQAYVGPRLDFGQPTGSLWAVFRALIICVQARMGASGRWVSSIRDRVGIDDFDPMTGSVRFPEPDGDLPAGRFVGVEEGSSKGQVRRRRCGERAAGAVEALRVPTPAKSTHSSAVVKDVDEGPFRVTSFDEDRAGPQPEDGSRRGLHRIDVRDP